MIDPKYTELMNLDLDGKATEAQRRELHRHLASHPEAAAHFESLGRMVRRLDAEPLAEPPAELHPRVMAAVDRAGIAPSRPAGAPGWLAGLFAPPRRRTASVFGLGLATGVLTFAVVQMAGSELWNPAAVDPSFVSGTMAPPSSPIAAIALDPTLDGLDGSVEFITDKGVTVIEARLDAPAPIDWSLAFDPSLTVSRIEAPASAALEFGAGGGGIHVRHSGRGTYRIVLSGRAEPVESVVLKVVRDGVVVVERPAAPLQ